MAKPRHTSFTRADHEDFAIRAMDDAKRALPMTYGCDAGSTKATIRAARAISRARVHLSSIGFGDGKRTRKLWGAVGKVDKHVAAAETRLAKCLIK